MSEGQSKVLTKDQLLAASGRETIEVDVPQWKGKVRVQELSAKDRGDLEREWQKSEDTDIGKWRVQMVALSVVDDSGARVFASEDDVTALGDKSFGAIDKIFWAIMELNGFGKKPEEAKAEAVDFTKTTSADSSSGLLSPSDGPSPTSSPKS